MYQKVYCTCRVVVLVTKLIAFLTFSLSSPSSLLRLPNKALRDSALIHTIFTAGSFPRCFNSCKLKFPQLARREDRVLTFVPYNVRVI